MEFDEALSNLIFTIDIRYLIKDEPYANVIEQNILSLYAYDITTYVMESTWYVCSSAVQ